MKPALVTGVSGFVGWHVARYLIDGGIPVRALVRKPGSTGKLALEEAIGDLRDPVSLRQAARGCGLAFHVAADYRLWARDEQEMYQSNVEGTRNLLQAAKDEGVERVVYTSTVGCIGFVKDGLGDETSPVGLQDMTGAYKRSKFQAEQVALEFAAGGYPVVIVNPTAPIGDRDIKPTPTGQTIVDFVKGAMPAYVDTGLNLVDVRDVAAGHWLACEKGKPGERYILGSENLSLQQIFERLQGITGVKAPQVQLPWVFALLAGAVSTGMASLSGNPPRVPLNAVRMARKKMFASHAKAEAELGYRPAKADGALQRAVAWFRANGYC